SALIHGGFAKKTVTELHSLMSKKAMHIPSPLRLLRLMNGKRCEFCHNEKVNHVRPCLGVFACWNCVTERGLTKAWKFSWVRYPRNSEAYDAIMQHPRVAGNRYGAEMFFWTQPRTLGDGEKIGPLVAFQDVDRMFDETKRGGTVDAYLQGNLKAPSEDAYEEFNDAYTDALVRSERVEKEREQKKAANKEKAKGNKTAKIEKMIRDLARLLDEPHREILLKHHAVDNTFRPSEIPCVKFEVPFVHQLLEPYIISPSKLRKKILEDIANTINQKIALIAEKKFLTLNYLSPTDPFEKAMETHFRPIVSSLDLESLLTTRARYLDVESGTSFTRVGVRLRFLKEGVVTNEFLKYLENDDMIAALACLEGNNLSCLLGATSDQEKILAKNVWWEAFYTKEDVGPASAEEDSETESAGDVSAEEDSEAENAEEVSAEEDSEAESAEEASGQNQGSKLRRAYAISRDMFPKVQQSLKLYKEWLSKKCVEDEQLRSYACPRAGISSSDLPLLEDRKFEELKEKQSHELWRLMF
ncbi:MAG: hypothetical protein SGILL_010285, partial [Bacillariaceae sp.]